VFSDNKQYEQSKLGLRTKGEGEEGEEIWIKDETKRSADVGAGNKTKQVRHLCNNGNVMNNHVASQQRHGGNGRMAIVAITRCFSKITFILYATACIISPPERALRKVEPAIGGQDSVRRRTLRFVRDMRTVKGEL